MYTRLSIDRLMFNRTTLIILVAALAVGLGLLAGQRAFNPPVTNTAVNIHTDIVKLFPKPRELPAFNLRQSDNTPLIPGELKGHWTLVFLGFTFCPDVCPMTLTELAQAQKKWEHIPEATRPRVLFVSVDPERDTPDKIGEYTRAFHADTLAATASVPELEAFTKSLSMVFAKVAAPDGMDASQYTIDHSATIAVLDPQGRMAGIIQPPLNPALIASDMIKLSEQKNQNK